MLLLLAAVHGPADATIRFGAPLLSQGGTTSDVMLAATFAIADLNEDGRLDVVAPQEGMAIGVLLGHGDGTLAPPIPVTALPGTGWHLAVGDFDADGHLDIGAVSEGEASIYFGDGSGTNWTRLALPIERGQDATAADLDGDGRPELVALMFTALPSSTGMIRTYWVAPDRTFLTTSSAQPSMAFGNVGDFRAVDLNADGALDLSVSSHWDYFGAWVALGQGGGHFSVSSVTETPIGNAHGHDVGDLTGDGHPDLVVARNRGVAIYPLLNGAFAGPSQTIGSSAQEMFGVACADVTSDGRLDLVYTERYSGAIVVRPGLPGSGFGSAVISAVDCVLYPFRLADMNGDEKLDVVALAVAETWSSFAPGVHVALGDGAGNFTPGSAEAALTGATRAFLDHGDFNQDGIADVVAVTGDYSSTAVRVFHGGPGRTMTLQQTIPIAGGYESADIHDLNGDGRQDLLVSGWNGPPQRLLGLADGTFGPAAAIGAAGASPRLAVADVTADGLADMVQATGGTLWVHAGKGDGSFDPPWSLPLGWSSAEEVECGDWNGDARADLAIKSTQGGQFSTRIFYGNTEGVPVPGPPWESWAYASATAGDLDGDGLEDLLETRSDYWYWPTRPAEYRRQLPDGTLAAVVTIPIPGKAIGPHGMVDLDGDGVTDLLTRGYHGAYVMLGQGDAGFELEGHYSGGGPADFDRTRRAGLADFDGDGRLDLMVLQGLWKQAPALAIWYGRDPEPPVVTVLAPAPPTRLVIGLPVEIAWSASDNEGLGAAEIHLSRHGPAGPFVRLGEASAGTGTWSWTVAGPVTDSACFKVVVHDLDGNVAWARSDVLGAILPATAVGPPAAARTSLGLTLLGARPVRDRVSARLTLARASRARLELHDLQGRHLATLLNADLPEGTTDIDASLSRHHTEVRSGLHFLRLSVPGESVASRVLVVR